MRQQRQRQRKGTKTAIRCRCTLSSGKQCSRRVSVGSPFCVLHQHCPRSPLSGAEPVYQPERYNHNPLIRKTHNCWAYGMNVLDPQQLLQCDSGKQKGCNMLYHQPGGTKGLAGALQEARGRSCKVVQRLIKADVPDIRRTTFKKRCPRDSSKIAMVVHPGDDYHFYRQDADGWWSHKDGSNKVKRYDAEGQPIWDPRTAARDYRPGGSFLNYTDFCGFYCVPRRKTIKLGRR